MREQYGGALPTFGGGALKQDGGRDMALANSSRVSDLFILIHGTFARGAAWTGENSSLSRALRNTFSSSKTIRSGHCITLKSEW